MREVLDSTARIGESVVAQPADAVVGEVFFLGTYLL